MPDTDTIVRVDARELYDANVTHISLVKYGANNTPVKFIKSQEDAGMFNIDFGSILGIKKTDNTPKVAAIVVNTEDAELYKSAISEAGFVVDAMEAKEDGTTVFKQCDYTDDNVTIIKSDNKVIVVTNVKKEFEVEGASKSFASNMQELGFMPSMGLAIDIFNETLYKVVKESVSAAEMSAAMMAAIDEFKAYTTTLANALPETVFKADKIVKSEAAIVEPTTVESVDAPADTDPPAAIDEGAVTSPDIDASATESDQSMDAPAIDENDTVSVTKEPAMDIAKAITEAMAPLITSMTTLSEQVAAITKSSEDATARMSLVESNLKKMDTALGSSIVSNATTDTTIAKQDTPKPPEFFTGVGGVHHLNGN